MSVSGSIQCVWICLQDMSLLARKPNVHLWIYIVRVFSKMVSCRVPPILLSILHLLLKPWTTEPRTKKKNKVNNETFLLGGLPRTIQFTTASVYAFPAFALYSEEQGEQPDQHMYTRNVWVFHANPLAERATASCFFSGFEHIHSPPPRPGKVIQTKKHQNKSQGNRWFFAPSYSTTITSHGPNSTRMKTKGRYRSLRGDAYRPAANFDSYAITTTTDLCNDTDDPAFL